jgi:phage repressor protein C with HTH and peptisase S24 domain
MRRETAVRSFHVEDWSMAPTYVPGDQIRVDTRAYAHKEPVPGDVVVINDPEKRGRKLIKRVEKAMHKGGRSLVFLIGDNELRSRDSRQFGPVAISEIIGRVLDAEPSPRSR